MSLSDSIRDAVLKGSWALTHHAQQRIRQRNIAPWQVEAGATGWTVLEERPQDLPNPSIVAEQELADGTSVTVVWAWEVDKSSALLVTIYF